MADGDSKTIGAFRIETELKTSGTQGRVYRAVCETDSLPWCARGTVVALKTMQVGGDAESNAERLRAHTEKLVRANHPNIVRYLGCFSEQSAFSEMHVIVQEFLHGESLKARLAEHPNGLDADEALKVVTGMISGLAAAVENGIIHRDVKPDNVFLCQDGSVKLIDFEVARQTENTTSVSGNMVGSFDYMAPDFTDPHFSGDERSDIFSAGAVMHEIFTGKLPYRRFTGEVQKASFAFLERWSRDGSGKFIRGACAISSTVERIVAHAHPILSKALSLQRENRFGSFAEFRDALSAIRFRDLKNGGTSYRILQLVGKGGFGEVFKARADGRTFAIKHLLKPEYASRFFREAKIMSELDDPCFVRFYDFFVLQHTGVREAFLVMDFLPGMPGSSLRDAIRRSAGCGLDFSSVLKAFARYAHGLKTIHERGIYHRDIKPTNLYYPEERPESASIMDLGIARDESGTETTGQVPGTLDYMPPETALGNTRGDAGMDIYALGLCFYEALSGKKGFPRLLTGSQGFAQFFQRARNRERPAFDDERVKSHPALLALLRKMTEPDVKDRLKSAEDLEKGIRRLLEGGLDAEPMTEPGTVTTSAAADAADSEEDDEVTCETAFVPQQSLPKAAVKVIDDGLRKLDKRRPARRKAFGLIFIGVILFAAASVALFRYRGEIDGYVGRMMQKIPMRGAGSATGTGYDAEDLAVPDVYGDDAVPVEKADELRDRWLSERKTVFSENEYVRAVGVFEQKREQRVIRNRLDSERTRFDAEVAETVKTYLEKGVAAGDGRRTRWLKDWNGASRHRIDGAIRVFDKARRDRLDMDAARSLVPRASSAADRIVKSYAENGLKIADREVEVWKLDWSKRLLKDDTARILQRMADARKAVVRRLEEERRNAARKALFDECHALLEMIVPVKSRDGRLFEAETKIRHAFGTGLVSSNECTAVLKEIAAAKSWTVFEIVNRSDLELKVGDVTIPNATSHVFTYTNAPPANLAVACFGYESVPLGRQTDGKVMTLLPEHFAMLKVEVTVGELESNVVCRVDGALVTDRTLRVLPGSHECSFCRPDYKTQIVPFRVEPGEPTVLPKPGTWVRSEDWLQRERDRKRAERAREIERTCAGLLQDEPISNRSARLIRCGKLLRDRASPDALGEQKLSELTTRLAAAELRSIGAIVNETSRAFGLDADGKRLEIPCGRRTLVEYSSKVPLQASLTAHGYDPIPLPQKFAGVEFRVVPAMVRPSPVEVTVHGLTNGIVCAVDGTAIPGEVGKFLPGDHQAVFSRNDFEDVRTAFTIHIGEPVTLHAPCRWTPSAGMVNLIAAEAAADRGDWNRAKTLLALTDVRGEDGLKRKMDLNLRFEQRKRFIARLDEASAAYHEERWHDVVKIHFDLKLNGYTMTGEDRERVAESIRKRAAHLDMLKKIATTGDFGASPEKIEGEIRSFNAMAGLLQKEIESAGKGEMK